MTRHCSLSCSILTPSVSTLILQAIEDSLAPFVEGSGDVETTFPLIGNVKMMRLGGKCFQVKIIKVVLWKNKKVEETVWTSSWVSFGLAGVGREQRCAVCESVLRVQEGCGIYTLEREHSSQEQDVAIFAH